MKINFAHLRERSTTGGFIDFAVFEANSNSGTDSGRAEVLGDLTMRARRQGLKIDVSALIFAEHGQQRTYGDRVVVDYLSGMGVPHWTHYLDV
jgi:hypothetical protein